MPAQLSRAADRLRALLAGFTAGQKAVTALALVGLLVGGVLFSSWAASPSLVPVFTNLAASDAAAITEELTTRGTPYELTEGGTTVLVPQQDVYQLRLDLSAAGLPRSGESGYELLDEQGITTSQFRQRVDFQRALEGELAKTISAIDGVQVATVHLVLPEENLFSEDSRQPSASVLIKNQPGKTTAPGQVQAVVNLVAGSVEGLEHDRVTVADAQGRVLSTAGEDGAGLAAGDARATQTATFEKGLQTSVEEMLLPLVGAGKAVVRVKAELDFDRRESVTETFETEADAPVVSERTDSEEYTGTGAVVGGVLGPENVPATDGGGSDYTKSQSERTYAVGKTTENAISAPGAIERLSVAVVLDAAADDGITTAAVEDLVAAATGFDEERGDVVKVSRLSFDDTAAQAAAAEFEALEKAERSSQLWSLVRTGAILLVVLLLVGHSLRVLRRDRRSVVDLPALELEAAQVPALAGAGAGAGALPDADRLALDAPQLDPDTVRRRSVQSEVGELVERQPEEVAQLLRGWLADRRS